MNFTRIRGRLLRVKRFSCLLLSVAACASTGKPPSNDSSKAVESRVTSGDAQLFVRSVGGGEGADTLVVLHGGWGLTHDYLVSLDKLATANLRMVEYDQRGCGRSTGTIDEKIIAAQVADLEEIRKALAVEKLHLAGHSAGGLIAWAYAIAHPERVKSLIFIDSVPPSGKQLADAFSVWGARRDALTKSGEITPAGEGSDSTTYLLSVLPVYFVDPKHPAARSLNDSKFDDSIFQKHSEALGDFDFHPQLSQLSIPSLVIAAAVPFGEMGRKIAEALPEDHVTLIDLQACGHMPFVECPDQFFGPVAAFVEKHR
jgi:proline iminopeptidase